MNNINQNILTAIDTIISQKLGEINFDNTIVCEILKVDKDKKEYIVSSGTSTFTAYADKEYFKGQKVYVTIPQNNYSLKKIIIGKYTAEDTTVYEYTHPFEKLVDITGNIAAVGASDGLTVIANENLNGTEAYFNIENITSIQSILGSYDYIGIRATITTLMENVYEGRYGIKLTLLDENNEEKNYIFDSNEFYGNPYYYDSGFELEKIFEYPKNLKFKSGKVTLYQGSNFSEAANGKEIKISDIYICFGYSQENFIETNFTINTSSSLEYSESASEKIIESILIDYDKTLNSYQRINNLSSFAYSWYRYRVGNGNVGGGTHWEQLFKPTEWITNEEKNKFYYYKQIYSLIKDYNKNHITFSEEIKLQKEENIINKIKEFNNKYNNTPLIEIKKEKEEIVLSPSYEEVVEQIEEPIGSILNEKEFTGKTQEGEYRFTFFPNENYQNEKIKCIVNYNNSYYISNFLDFNFKGIASNKEFLKETNGQIILSFDNTIGQYPVYGEDNNFIKEYDSSTSYTIKASFADERDWDNAEKIEWKYAENSLITVKEATIKNGKYVYENTKDSEGKLNNAFVYKLKEPYYPSQNILTIYCYVTDKSGNISSDEIKLQFGKLGSSGTDFTLYLTDENGEAPWKFLNCFIDYDTQYDYNQDGQINLEDAFYLQYHLEFGNELYPIPSDKTIDVNKDGNVDNNDLVSFLYKIYDTDAKILVAHVAGPNGKELELTDEEKAKIKWEWVYGFNESSKATKIIADFTEGGNQKSFKVKALGDYCNAILKISYPVKISEQFNVNLICYHPIAVTNITNAIDITGAIEVLYDTNGNVGKYDTNNYNLKIQKATGEIEKVETFSSLYVQNSDVALPQLMPNILKNCGFWSKGSWNVNSDSNLTEYINSITRWRYLLYTDTFLDNPNNINFQSTKKLNSGNFIYIISKNKKTFEKLKISYNRWDGKNNLVAQTSSYESFKEKMQEPLNLTPELFYMIYEYEEQVDMGVLGDKEGWFIFLDVEGEPNSFWNDDTIGVFVIDSQTNQYLKANPITNKYQPNNIPWISVNLKPWYLNKDNKLTNDIWQQPIFLHYNQYGTKFLNSWEGQLVIDRDNNTILSSLLVAGEKNNENQFTGVIIGDIEKANNTENLYGIYGYKNGIKSFSIDENGDAYLSGVIEANKGLIGGVYIENNSINIAGQNGISNFLVNDEGNTIITNGTLNGNLSGTLNIDMNTVSSQGNGSWKNYLQREDIFYANITTNSADKSYSVKNYSKTDNSGNRWYNQQYLINYNGTFTVTFMADDQNYNPSTFIATEKIEGNTFQYAGPTADFKVAWMNERVTTITIPEGCKGYYLIRNTHRYNDDNITGGMYWDDSAISSSGFQFKVETNGHLTADNPTFKNVNNADANAINSDQRLKHDITPLSSSYLDLIKSLQPVTYKYNDGTSNRLHTGFIAQQVEEALLKNNLTTKDFAALVLNKNTEHYALRYEEFIALNTFAIQELYKYIEKLENRIQELEKKEDKL